MARLRQWGDTPSGIHHVDVILGLSDIRDITAVSPSNI